MFINIVKVPTHRWAWGAIQAEICALIQRMHGQNVMQIFRIVFFHSNIQVRTVNGKLQTYPVLFCAGSIVNFESLLQCWSAKLFIPLSDNFQIQTFQVLLNSLLLWSVPWEISNFSLWIIADRLSTFLLLPHENLSRWFVITTPESNVGIGSGYFWHLMNAIPS